MKRRKIRFQNKSYKLKTSFIKKPFLALSLTFFILTSTSAFGANLRVDNNDGTSAGPNTWARAVNKATDPTNTIFFENGPYTINMTIAPSVLIKQVTITTGASGIIIFGTGVNALEVGAGGTFITNNDLAFTGNNGLVLNASTAELQLTASTYTSQVNLGAGGGRINPTTTVALSGLVAGSGALEKTGANQLALSNTSNSYSGGTTVSAGTLATSAAGTLGTGTLTLNGGTFNQTLGYTTANNLSFGSSNGTIKADSFSAVFSGDISGDGKLTITGSGQTSFTGTSNTMTSTAADAIIVSVSTLRGNTTNLTTNITNNGTLRTLHNSRR